MLYTIFNPKGGVGKSTIAINLAHFFTLQAEKTLLLDTDPQRSVFLWNEIRQNSTLHVAYSNDISEIEKYLSFFDFIINDTSGSDRDINTKLLEKSYVCIVPVNVGLFNISVLHAIFEYLDSIMQVNTKLKAYILMNRANTNSKIKHIETLKEMIANKKVALCYLIVFCMNALCIKMLLIAKKRFLSLQSQMIKL